KYSMLNSLCSARATASRWTRGESVGPKRTSASLTYFLAVESFITPLSKSYGEHSYTSRRMVTPLVVKSSKICCPFITSTLKADRKTALVQAQKSVDNYVDASRNCRNYPQAAQSARGGYPKSMAKAQIIVDGQDEFCHGGSWGAERGDEGGRGITELI